MISKYEQRALEWAERYGIVKYRTRGCMMVYNKSYPAYLGNKRYTIQHIVNLDTGHETIKRLQRYSRDGEYNI